MYNFFPNSPNLSHLLEIVYCAAISASVWKPHLTHKMIRNMLIYCFFIVYLEITCKGMGVTYGPGWPHAVPPQLSSSVSQRHELRAEDQFTPEGYDSVIHNCQFLCHCWDRPVCRNCWCRWIPYRLILNLQKKKKKKCSSLFRGSVLSAISACS